MSALKTMVKELTDEKETLQKRINILNDTISSLQFLCRHDWEDGGHDSHHYYEKCTNCGLTQKI